MPVYEYRCERGHDLELLQPIGAEAPGACPRCGTRLQKRFSRVAVRYGSWGFNATDKLVSRPGEKNFKQLRDRAERIADE